MALIGDMRFLTIGNKTYQIPIPTKTSELENDSNFMTGMTILSYGISTWNDFITAYKANHVVYCRASSNANPASGSQTRMAFMAYVSDATNPTNVEFQYYRSVSSHTASQQGDQVYVYKLTSGNAWTVTVREASVKITTGSSNGINAAYSNGAVTIGHTNSVTAKTTQALYPITYDAQGHITGSGSAVTIPTVPTNVSAFTNDAGYLTDYTETDPTVPSWAKASSKPSYNFSEIGSTPTTISGYGITDAKIASGVITLGSNTITPLTSSSTLSAAKLSGAIPSAVTATTQASTDNSTKIATTAYVTTAIANLPEPMLFKGSVGTGGTITSLPTAAASNEGFTYKVITALSTPVVAKVGDTVISNGSEWVVIPSGDEPSGTVTSVGVSNATNGGLTISGSPITSSGTVTIGHSNVLTSAQTTQAVYPIKIDKNGHISAYGSAITIPTKTSDLTNDAGYTTNTGTITQVKTTAGAHTTINVSSGAATFNVPTKTSHLMNDSGFVTNTGQITVEGNLYSITSRTVTTISGVEGIAVGYDDGTTDGGMVFLPDGIGMNAVKTAIEAQIPDNIVNTITTTAGAHTTISNQEGDISFNVPTTAAHVGALSTSGGTITGNTTLSGADKILNLLGPAGSNSPILRFQRGELTDNYNDWQIQDRAGYLYFDERGSGSTTWTNRVMFDTSGRITAAIFNGNGSELTNVVHTETDPTVPAWAKASTKPSYAASEVGAVADCTLSIYNGVGGNPGVVKFCTVDYTSCTSEAGVLIKITMRSGHGNGASYNCWQDAVLSVTYTGVVSVNIYRYYAGSVTYSSATHYYGDILYTIDTTNKVVKFYTLMGQYASIYQSPYLRLNASTGGSITQHTGSAIRDLSGTSTFGNVYWLDAGARNLLDGSAVGSLRGVGSVAESSAYTIGQYAIAEGSGTKASGNYSHAEGIGDDYYVTASGTGSHAEGCDTTASGNYSHAEGNASDAIGYGAHAEGYATQAIGYYSHSGGYYTRSKGLRSFVHGAGPKAYSNTATAADATIFTNFYNTIYGASGWYATNPTEYSSSDPRYGSIALGDYSIATGSCVLAYGFASHAEGCSTIAYGDRSHAQNCSTQARGTASSAAGWGTIAGSENQFVIGKWNTEDSNNNYAFIIGKGSGPSGSGSSIAFDRSDALTVDWDGKLTIEGHTTPIGSIIEASGSTSKSLGANSVVNLMIIDLPPGAWIVIGSAQIASASGNKSTSLCIANTATAMNARLSDGNSRIDYFRTTTGSYMLSVTSIVKNTGTTNKSCYLNVQTSAATSSSSYYMRAIRIS